MLDRDGCSSCHTRSPVTGLYAVTVSELGTPTVSSRSGPSAMLSEWPTPLALWRNVSPTGFTFSATAAFFPVTYSRPVRGLNAGDPKLEPPCDTMYSLLIEYGKYIC